jgi:hypothetical protein
VRPTPRVAPAVTTLGLSSTRCLATTAASETKPAKEKKERKPKSAEKAKAKPKKKEEKPKRIGMSSSFSGTYDIKTYILYLTPTSCWKGPASSHQTGWRVCQVLTRES